MADGDTPFVPGPPNNTPSTSPVRPIRSQADDARAYRREHALCFYCGGKDHTLKDCHVAPHNRGIGTISLPSGVSKAMNGDSARTVTGNSPKARDESMEQETSRLPFARPEPVLDHRPDLTGQSLPKLTAAQWAECLNTTLLPSASQATDQSAVTLEMAIDALLRYIAIRYTDRCGFRGRASPFPLTEAERHHVVADVRKWESLPRSIKSEVIAKVKLAEEQKLMAALNIIGEKIMKEAPTEIKLQFQGVFEFCIGDE